MRISMDDIFATLTTLFIVVIVAGLIACSVFVIKADGRTDYCFITRADYTGRYSLMANRQWRFNREIQSSMSIDDLHATAKKLECPLK
jgi:hypothetical protein